MKDNVFIWKPPALGNKEEIMGPREVCERWGINNVAQVVDILGLMGDAVDNIPGIPGVGEKTATKLLAEWGTLENAIANADKIPGKLGEKVRAGADSAILSKKLATIITDVPVAFHEENFCCTELNKEKLSEIFTELEFKSLGKTILGDSFNALGGDPSKPVQQDLFGNPTEAPAPSNTLAQQAEAIELPGLAADKNIGNTPHNYILSDTPEKHAELVALLMQAPVISFDTETTGTDANAVDIVGMSFSVQPAEGWYIPCRRRKTR